MIKPGNEEPFYSDKILNYEQAKEAIKKLKARGKKTGISHGGFDLLHPGHMKHLESAKKLCDILVVSVTADEFVSTRKGSGRPVFNQRLRAYSLACLECVDYVVISNCKRGLEVIKNLNPDYYIKGPDYIKKETPGIKSERQAIKDIGGKIMYTNDPKLSTTEIIRHIKTDVKRKKVLVGVDRDGTIIKDTSWLGKDNNWKSKVKINKDVVSFLIHLQTKYDTTMIVITNQSGVARGYFSCDRVEEINQYIGNLLNDRGLQINNWQYCPEVDSVYAEKNRDHIEFREDCVKKESCRKPSTVMIMAGIKQFGKQLDDFDSILILGDRKEDEELAKKLKAKFINVKKKNCFQLIEECNIQLGY